jgi:hypothetical protein
LKRGDKYMKKLILGTVAAVTLMSSLSAKADMDRIADIAAAKTDLHFCVTMTEGVSYTATQDAGILKALGCDTVIDELKGFGESDEDILKVVKRALKAASLDKLERCADQALFGDKSGCDAELESARELGVTDQEIHEELGILSGIILN